VDTFPLFPNLGERRERSKKWPQEEVRSSEFSESCWRLKKRPGLWYSATFSCLTQAFSTMNYRKFALKRNFLRCQRRAEREKTDWKKRDERRYSICGLWFNDSHLVRSRLFNIKFRPQFVMNDSTIPLFFVLYFQATVAMCESDLLLTTRTTLLP
jgi:hypothetical protein